MSCVLTTASKAWHPFDNKHCSPAVHFNLRHCHQHQYAPTLQVVPGGVGWLIHRRVNQLQPHAALPVQVVPGGVVVFFPSFSYADQVQARWAKLRARLLSDC